MKKLFWYKSFTDSLEDERMRYLRTKRGWHETAMCLEILMRLAAKCNSGGRVCFLNRKPYTPELLSQIYNIEVSVIKKAFEELEAAEYIRFTEDGIIEIIGWCESQGLCDLKQDISKKKKKSEAKKDIDINLNLNKDKDKNKNKNTDKEKDKEKEKEETAKRVVDAFNTACASYPKIKFLSDKQKQAVSDSVENYGFEALELCFAEAEKSDFLKGANKKNWTATFDWLINSENIAKVLNGNYSDRTSKDIYLQGDDDFVSHSYDFDEFVETALARGFG